MRVGQARKRDWNEPEIVAALLKMGALVEKLSGPGLPDLLVCYRRKVFLLEVKTPRGRATEAQKQRTQQGWPVHTVLTPAGALAIVGGLAA